MSDDLYHVELHKSILFMSALAEWIYFDCFYDCDSQATERTNHRLNAIQAEHGTQGLFGLAAGWAAGGARILRSFYAANNKPIPPLVQLLTVAATDPAEKRAETTSIQFIQAVDTDDLEMAEALFNAAAGDSDEALSLVLGCVLHFVLKLTKMVEAADHGHEG